MTVEESRDAHAKPPPAIRDVFKRCQRLDIVDFIPTGDFSRVEAGTEDILRTGTPASCFAGFVDHHTQHDDTAQPAHADPVVYKSCDIPGLYLFPNLFSPDSQVACLEKLFDRDLLSPAHQTNVHMHYHVQYPADEPDGSFFKLPPDLAFPPKDPSCHKPMTVKQFLERKLRWLTLGGQYDWTRKEYPAEAPPPFPTDFRQLLEGLFPMTPEAAIVNLYTPGDTLALHRDVSEHCDSPLVSMSVGCESIFVIGLDDSRVATMKLKSGAAALMTGESRFAWHGIPKVMEGTCPDWLADWPGEKYPQWKGWMARKRINLNVRQMFG